MSPVFVMNIVCFDSVESKSVHLEFMQLANEVRSLTHFGESHTIVQGILDFTYQTGWLWICKPPALNFQELGLQVWAPISSSYDKHFNIWNPSNFVMVPGILEFTSFLIGIIAYMYFRGNLPYQTSTKQNAFSLISSEPCCYLCHPVVCPLYSFLPSFVLSSLITQLSLYSVLLWS